MILFPILENKLLEKVKNNYEVTEWAPYDKNHTIVRFVCSWATQKSVVQDFYNDMVSYINKK